MMKKKKRLEGFTLVELVIVIAVIAILAGVLIPTFANIINNAKLSTDTQLANAMNKSLVSYRLNEPNPNASASEIRHFLGVSGIVPMNNIDESYWLDLDRYEIIVSKAENLPTKVSAASGENASILEEIVPGYLLMDTGGTKIGEMIFGLRNLGSAEDYEQIMANISTYAESYASQLHFSTAQYEYMLTHLAGFSLDKTIYVNDFTYITTAINSENVLVDNIVFCENIIELPSVANSFTEEQLTLANPDDSLFADGEDNFDSNRIGIAIKNEVIIPSTVEIISKQNILWYVTGYRDIDTHLSFMTTNIKTEGAVTNYYDKLFSEYVVTTNNVVSEFNVQARPEPLGECTFEIATDQAVQKLDKNGNTYSEVSLKIIIPWVVNEELSEELGETIYWNKGIKNQRYRYTNLADGRVRVDVKIYDDYGVLYNGTIAYPPEIKVDNFKFNSGILSFSTPISNDTELSNHRKLLNENEKLVYKVYINGEQVAELDADEYFTGNALTDYVLDERNDADICMMFLIKNDAYEVHDNLGNYCLYDVTTDTYNWYNSSNVAIDSLGDITLENVGNYTLKKEDSYSPEDETSESVIKEYSTINMTELNGEKVLLEYFYTSVITITQTENGEYLTNKVVEIHSAYDRYIYPRLVPLDYLTLNYDEETGKSYYTMDASVELIIRNTAKTPEQEGYDILICSNHDVFGTLEQGLRSYYLSSVINQYEYAEYNYNYTFKNPLYYTVEDGQEHMELLAFTDKQVITYTQNAPGTYTFKISGTGANKKKGLTLAFGDINSKVYEYYDCEYQVKYTYNAFYDRVDLEILGLDSYYSIYNNDPVFNTIAYSSRMPYKMSVLRNKIEKEESTTYELLRFNGKVPEAIVGHDNEYTTTIFENENFNPLTTQFKIVEGETETVVNAEIFRYTIEELTEGDYDVLYTFRIGAGKDIKVYCQLRNINLNVSFLHEDIGSSTVISKYDGVAGDYVPYTYYNNVAGSTLACAYNEEIILSVNSEYALDSKYGFVAWYSVTEMNGKELISTEETATYRIPGGDVRIICEFATNPLNNDVFLFSYSGTSCTISWCNDKTIDEVYVPTYSGNYLVTKIGDNVFAGASNLSKVYIPDTVTTISYTAFRNTQLDFSNDIIAFGTYYYVYNDNSVDPDDTYHVPEGIITIGASAFQGNETLKYVYLADSVTTIGDKAFYKMKNLEYIYCTSNSQLTTIGASSFAYSFKFKGFVVNGVECVFPETLTTIGDSAFYMCGGIEEVNFTNVTTLTQKAFYYCTGLKSLSFADTKIKTIPAQCFYGCCTLESVDFGTTITTINADAFSTCSGLTEVSLANTPLKTLNAIFTTCASLETIYLPAGTDSIPNNFFKDCNTLKEIYIGEELIDFTKIKSIGEYAFYNCIVYPFGDITVGSAGLTISVGTYAFYNCLGLTGIKFAGTWSLATLPANTFEYCTSLVTAELNGITAISGYAFRYCSSLVSVKGVSLTVINAGVFNGCFSLKTLPIDYTKVTTIGSLAFNDCSSLEFGNLVLGNPSMTLLTIVQASFKNTTKLNSITINAKRVEFRTTSSGAVFDNFIDCTGLKSIEINCDKLYFVAMSDKAMSATSTSIFIKNCPMLEKVSLNTMEQYYKKNGTSYTDVTNNTYLPYNFCAECPMLAEVVIPNNCTGFNTGAFVLSSASAKLTNIRKYFNPDYNGTYVVNPDLVFKTVASTLTNTPFASAVLVDNFLLNSGKTTVFAYLGNAESVTLPSTVTTINARAFAGNNYVKSVTIDQTLTAINIEAFANCSAIESLILNSTEMPGNISGTAFKGINPEVMVIVPNELLNSYKVHPAFTGLTINNTLEYELIISETGELTGYTGFPIKLFLPDTVKSIASNVFKDYTRLTSVEMTSVTNIKSGAFEGCTSLASVTFNGGLTTIGDNAFNGCSALSFEIPATVTSIGANAFKGTNVTSVTLPIGINTVGSEAFNIPTLTKVFIMRLTVVPATLTSPTFGTNEELKIYVSKNSVDSYKSAWTDYADKITYDGESVITVSSSKTLTAYTGNATVLDLRNYDINRIGDNVFKNNTTLQTVIFKHHVLSIGISAFQNCTSLRTVDFGTTTLSTTRTSTDYIFDYAFQGCKKLTTISGQSIDTFYGVKQYAFDGCESLVYDDLVINLALGTGRFGAYAFRNCKKIAKITYTKGTTSMAVNEGLFKGCTGLKELTLPPYNSGASLKVYKYAFAGCSKLEKINNLDFSYVAETQYVGNYAFDGCSSLDFGETLVLPAERFNSTVADYGYYVFRGCAKLKKVEFTGSSNVSGQYLFQNCTGLESVALPKYTSNTFKINTGLFDGCINLKQVYTYGSTPVEDTAVLDRTSQVNGYSFRNCDSIKHIIIQNKGSNSCTINQAFNEMDNLETIEFRTAVVLNKANIFQNDVRLNNIDFTNATITANLEAGLFSGCRSFTTATFNGTTIPTQILRSATSLTTVYAKNVTVINARAFEACTNLRDLYIDFKKVTFIGSYAFQNCKKLELKNYTFDSDGNITSEDATKLIIGKSGVTVTMNQYAFNGTFNRTDGIDTIEIRGTLSDATTSASPVANKIATYLFMNGTSIKHIIWNTDANITAVAAGAFYNCTQLQTIDGTGFALANITSFGGSVFTNCKALSFGRNLTIAANLTSNIFPANYEMDSIRFTNMTAVPASMFEGWYNLKSVQFDKTLATIGSKAFYNCYKLESILGADGKSINLKSLTSLGDYAFYNCRSLVFASDNVTGRVVLGGTSSVSVSATGYEFYNNFKLKEVVINSTSQTTIGDYIFYGCVNLEKLSIPSTIKTFKTYALKSCVRLEYIYNSNASEPEYFDFGSVTTVGSYAFDMCLRAKYNDSGTLNLSKVTSLAEYAFRHNVELKKVTLTGALTSIPKYAFGCCTNLEEITISNTIKTIVTYAFNMCESLETIYTIVDDNKVPHDFSNITSIETYAFNQCFSLNNNFVLSSITTSIPDYTFKECRSIRVVDFSANTTMTTIGSYAFINCDNLEEIRLGSAVTTIGSYAFQYCHSLRKIAYGDGNNLATIRSIGDYAFNNCHSLPSVTFNSNLTKVSQYAFQNCVSLETVVFDDIENAVCTTIGTYAFYGCIRIRTMDLPATITSIGAYAYARCTVMYAINMRNVLPETPEGEEQVLPVINIDAKALQNSNKIYFTFATPEITEVFKDVVVSYSNRIYSRTIFDEDALALGFVIANNRLVAYDGTGDYKYIRVYNDRIEYKATDDEAYHTYYTNIDVVLAYTFVYLDDMKVLSLDSGVQAYPDWNYRIVFDA